MKRINRSIFVGLFCLALLLAFMAVYPVQAQDSSELSLRLSRDFGYSSGMGAMQGTFSMRVTGPDNLNRVEFFIDQTKIGEVTQAPFNLRFNTDAFSLGAHKMYAIGYTQDGKELYSNEIQARFVSPEEGMQAAGKIIIPVLVLVVLGMLFSYFVTASVSKKNKNLPPGAARTYGPAGGAICPKCQRPFSRHILSPNMLLGKLERCPYCGKWSIVRARSLDELRAAEQAEIEDNQAGFSVELDSEEKMRQELEKSRYRDL